jgi:hypothetical protein
MPGVHTNSQREDMKNHKVRLAGSEFEGTCHACALFHSEAQAYDVLLPFVKEGLECGDRGFHIIDPDKHAAHVARLRDAGIDAEPSDDGSLQVRHWEDAYLRPGRFDQQAMIQLIQDVLRDGRARGFARTRLVAHMEWALLDKPGVEDLVEYETRLNYVLPQYDDTVVCTYDISRFSAPVVIDILRTHPMVVIGDRMHINPFYVPPDQLISELTTRKPVAQV